MPDNTTGGLERLRGQQCRTRYSPGGDLSRRTPIFGHGHTNGRNSDSIPSDHYFLTQYDVSRNDQGLNVSGSDLKPFLCSIGYLGRFYRQVCQDISVLLIIKNPHHDTQ